MFKSTRERHYPHLWFAGSVLLADAYRSVLFIDTVFQVQNKLLHFYVIFA